MQANSIYKKLVAVWIHRLTGYSLMIGAGVVGLLSFLHLCGAEFDTVANTWFGFDVTSSQLTLWVHMNPGITASIALFVFILGSKFATDAAPHIGRLTDEHIIAKSAEAARFALQDMTAQLAHSLTDIKSTASGAEQIASARKHLIGRINQVMADVAGIDPKQAEVLDPEEIIRAEGMLTYVRHQLSKEALKINETAAILSDLETAKRLVQETHDEHVGRKAELHQRLEDAIREAQQLRNATNDSHTVVPMQKPAAE